ncbi:DUF2797 domain-containing protein [Aliamphritea hakodatensis]|uniref:DUF2797 domain-containing protein n=1 Tax=Aliamphritea hakodatensis TaxID=2895352 RepID=UPI0035E461FE
MSTDITILQQLGCGALSKMPVSLAEPVEYRLQLDEQQIVLNEYLGRRIRLSFAGEINCTNCGRKTKKSFAQGFCYPCFKKLPQCDTCIMAPERCHFHLGTCRDPEWGERFCKQSHYVYLANSSGIKVGITRGNQLPTRWIDQGAVQALPILKVSERRWSGLVERVIGQHVSDKTNWRTMLKGQTDTLDLIAERDRLLALCADELAALEQEHDTQFEHLSDSEVLEINYPVLNYPSKVSSHNLDKTPEVEGVLQGIKGQYLILDTGVINIRKFTAYRVEFSAV